MREGGLEADLEHWPCVYTLEDDWYRNRHPFLNRIAMHGLRSDVLEAARDRLLAGWARRRSAIARADRASVAYARIGLELLGQRCVWVDATKEPMRLAHLARVPELCLFALHLVRDPRGYCNSVRQTNRIGWSAAARQWLWNARNARRVLRRLPEDRRLLLRYEDLCDDPVRELNRIATLLGLRALRVYDFQAPGHHIIGNRMRGNELSAFERDERWKSQMSTGAIKVVELIAGRVARDYGYYF
jgi:hypothetical protein